MEGHLAVPRQAAMGGPQTERRLFDADCAKGTTNRFSDVFVLFIRAIQQQRQQPSNDETRIEKKRKSTTQQVSWTPVWPKKPWGNFPTETSVLEVPKLTEGVENAFVDILRQKLLKTSPCSADFISTLSRKQQMTESCERYATLRYATQVPKKTNPAPTTPPPLNGPHLPMECVCVRSHVTNLLVFEPSFPDF